MLLVTKTLNVAATAIPEERVHYDRHRSITGAQRKRYTTPMQSGTRAMNSHTATAAASLRHV